jgi:hypothetical protein
VLATAVRFPVSDPAARAWRPSGSGPNAGHPRRDRPDSEALIRVFAALDGALAAGVPSPVPVPPLIEGSVA